MNKAVGADGKVIDAQPAPDPKPQSVMEEGFVSMGDVARAKKDKEDAASQEAEAKKKAEQDAKDKAEADAKARQTETKTEDGKTSDGSPAPKKVEVVKAKPIEEIVEGVVRKLEQEKPAPQPSTTTKTEEKPATDPDADFLSGRTDEEQEAVELARFAAKSMPDKYGQLPQKMIKYLKDVDSYIDSKRKEDPDWDPDQDTAFSEFIAENQPKYQPGDKRRIERAMITEEVKATVVKEFQPKLEEADRRVQAQELKPEVDKAAAAYTATVAQRMVPDEKSPFAAVIKTATEKGLNDEAWKEAAAVDPLAAQVAQSYMGQASSLGREYLELVAGTTQQARFDPNLPPTAPVNQKALTHQRLFGFISAQENYFAQNGGDARVINGRSFVSRAEFSKMDAKEKGKHWTIGHDDVLDMLATEAAKSAKVDYENRIKQIEAAGYTKSQKAPETKQETPPGKTEVKTEDKGGSPKATVSPQPGAANLNPPQAGKAFISEEDLKRQWAGGHAAWAPQ